MINILLLGPPKSGSVFSHRLIVRKRWGDWGLIFSGKSQKKGVSGEKVWAEVGFWLFCNGWVALETHPWTWNLLNLTNFPLQSRPSSRWCSAPSAESVSGSDLSFHVALLLHPPATVTSPPPDWFSLQACVAWLHIANGHGCLASPQITPMLQFKKHPDTHKHTRTHSDCVWGVLLAKITAESHSSLSALG